MSHQRQTDRPAQAAARGSDRPHLQSQRGVTVIELLATTAISAVILGVAAPNFVESVRVNRARSAAQHLTGLLNEARTEAIKRNVPVLVCPSSDGTSCLSAVTAASWAGLTIACYDVNGDGACDASTLTAPNPIRVRGQVDSSVALSGPTAVIRFNGLGAVSNGTSFSLSAGAAAGQSSTISVAATGVARAY